MTMTEERPAPRPKIKRTRNEKHPSGNGEPWARGILRVSPTTADLIDDPSSIEDWDDEELRRGRKRDRNGKFTGRDPVVVPTVAYREIVRRAIGKAQLEMARNLQPAVDTLIAICQSPLAENRDKIKAAGMIMDRVMGKEPQEINLKADAPVFLGIIQAGIVAGGQSVAYPGLPELGNGDIIDAEVVDDDDIVFEE